MEVASGEKAQPLRILSIYRGALAHNRGTPIRVRSLLAELARDARFELVVASWDDTVSFARHVRLSNRKSADIWALFGEARGADIVLGHTIATWYYLLLLKIFLRKRIVLEMHGFVEEESRLYGSIGSLRFRAQKIVFGAFYRVCDAITTCSETASETLRRYNEKVTTIWGGADTDLFRPLADGSSPQLPRALVIGYAGNTRLWQGLPFLVEAFRSLAEREDGFELRILSSESKGVPEEGRGIHVVRGVPHEQVPQFLVSCDVLVIPRLENEVNRLSFPSKLIEYMAMGKSVVASATSDCQRVITHGLDGFIFPPGDREALIRILHSLRDPALRDRTGRAARETAVSTYGWPHQAATLARVLTVTAAR